MKKIIIVVSFISITLVLTLQNISTEKDSSNISIKLKNIEAFASEEIPVENPCKKPGAICMYYDENKNPIFYPGLTLE